MEETLVNYTFYLLIFSVLACVLYFQMYLLLLHILSPNKDGGGEVTKGNDMKADNGFILNDAEGSERSISFVDLRSFNRILNNLILDSELPKHIRFKYHDLCHAQKAYLHVALLKCI